MEVTLIIHSVDGAREVPVPGSRLTLGRTEPADVVINDHSLSRVHASINRDGDRVWIIDEGSTNGSLVNGAAVPLMLFMGVLKANGWSNGMVEGGQYLPGYRKRFEERGVVAVLSASVGGMNAQITGASFEADSEGQP